MKHALTILCLVLATSVGAAERDAPAFRAFPNPGSDWSSADDRQLDDGQFSWRHYKHEKTGDVIAVVAWHTPRLSIDTNPVRQASIETITSSGYAYAKTRKLGQPIDDTVRHHVASIIVQNHAAAKKNIYRAIEYTYVYESADGKSRSAMAHGYVVHVGDFTIFVQHTANRIITSDIAQSMAMDLAIAESKKQTSLPKGWSASISR
jgi:hypothetical protein